MPIRALVEGESGVFGPDDLKALTLAFEDILRALGLTDRNDPMVTIVAKLTIETAKQHGERDAARLRAAVLSALSA